MERIDAAKIQRFVTGRLTLGELPPTIYESAVAGLVKDYIGTAVSGEDIIYISRVFNEIHRALQMSLGASEQAPTVE